MLKLSLEKFKVFDNSNKDTNTFMRNPELPEACELESMY